MCLDNLPDHWEYCNSNVFNYVTHFQTLAAPDEYLEQKIQDMQRAAEQLLNAAKQAVKMDHSSEMWELEEGLLF